MNIIVSAPWLSKNSAGLLVYIPLCVYFMLCVCVCCAYLGESLNQITERISKHHASHWWERVAQHFAFARIFYKDGLSQSEAMSHSWHRLPAGYGPVRRTWKHKVWRQIDTSLLCFKWTWIDGHDSKSTWTTRKKRQSAKCVYELSHTKSLKFISLFSSLGFVWKCTRCPPPLNINRSHTMESLIMEPSLTRGRGPVAEISTWLSFRFRGLFSDSEKLLLLSGDEHSCGGVLQK